MTPKQCVCGGTWWVWPHQMDESGAMVMAEFTAMACVRCGTVYEYRFGEWCGVAQSGRASAS